MSLLYKILTVSVSLVFGDIVIKSRHLPDIRCDNPQVVLQVVHQILPVLVSESWSLYVVQIVLLPTQYHNETLSVAFRSKEQLLNLVMY